PGKGRRDDSTASTKGIVYNPSPMRVHHPLRAALLALALFGLGCNGARPGGGAGGRKGLAGAARGWNVILLSVDTLRADHLGAYGYKARQATSPRMDALLASGVRFEAAMAQRAATWPSLATVLSGLYPSAHGVSENGYGFPDDL